MSCIGCKLTNGEIDSQIIYENEGHIALLDYNPYNEGHILILPKRHVAEIVQLTSDEATALFDAIRLLTEVLNRAVKPDGITVMQNGGIFNDLAHVHFHLIPRYKDEDFSQFFMEEEGQIEQHEALLPVTREKLVSILKQLIVI